MSESISAMVALISMLVRDFVTIIMSLDTIMCDRIIIATDIIVEKKFVVTAIDRIGIAVIDIVVID